MAAYSSTPLSTQVTLAAATAAKAPATAQTNRVLLKIFNDDTANPVYYGGSTVTTSTGIYIAPGGESEWIPCSGDIWALSTPGTTIRVLELA